MDTQSHPCIVIPIYRDLTATRACLDSVRRHSAEYTLVLINDASPEPELTRWLQQYAAEDLNVHLIENAANLGFVQSANRGLMFDPARDVILLNSDTVVTAGWVSKLQAWAAADWRVATVTPFSNNATICSYPRICCNNELPDGLSADALNALFEAAWQHNPSGVVEVPTGVGFCLYIRRYFINQVGLFNHEAFGRGYGEENDFCQRCLEKGGIHLVALDTFVYHRGEVSFGADAACQCEAAQKKLQRLHPQYTAQVEVFLDSDPLVLVRRQVDLQRLAAAPRPGILLIGHGLGGGTQHHLQDLHTLWAARNWHPFVLTPAVGGGYHLASGLPAEEFNVTLKGQSAFQSLVTLLPRLHIRQLHYHHLLGYPRAITDLPQALGLPFDVTLHDYFALCPFNTGFDRNAEYYCGLIPQNNCETCMPAALEPEPMSKTDPRPKPRPLMALGRFPSMREWRTFHQQFLSQARRIITPSRAAADIYARFFPRLPMEVIPHPETRLPSRRLPNIPGNILNVGIVGGISPQKGRRLMEKVVARARAGRLPLRWVIIGTTDIEYQCVEDDYIVTGPYQRDELPALFDQYQIHIGLLPACWPETFSYVLSEFWFSGIPVIVPDLGAPGERMRSLGGGWLLPPPLTAETIIDKLTSIANTPHDFFARCKQARQYQEVRPALDLPLLAEARPDWPPPTPRDVDELLLRLITSCTYHHNINRMQALLAREKNALTLTTNHVINLENSLQENQTALDYLRRFNQDLQKNLELCLSREEIFQLTQRHAHNLEHINENLMAEIETRLCPCAIELERQRVALAERVHRFESHWLIRTLLFLQRHIRLPWK